MQGQRELGAAPGHMPPRCAFLSDLAEQAGGVSFCRVSKDSGAGSAPGRQSSDAVEWASPRSLLPPPDGDGEARISGRGGEGLSASASGPDLGEHSGAWGEFEGFRESSARSEQFSQSFELPERPTEPQPPRTISAQEERGSRQSHQGGPGVTGTSAITPSEVLLKYSSLSCCTGSVSYVLVGWPGRGSASLRAFIPPPPSFPPTFLRGASAHSPSTRLCFPGPSLGHGVKEHFV